MNVHDYPLAYACYSQDDTVRSKSSSGGMFSVFAEKVLDLGGVVFGAAFNDSWNVEHICVERKSDLWKLYGSKYVQSNIGDVFYDVKENLLEDRYVLFCGTPCQVEGLKSFLNKEFDKLLLIDLICHGVSSPQIWEEYLDEIKNGRAISNISFRDKSNGWSHFSIRIGFTDGSEYIKEAYDDPFMCAYLNNIILRPACYQCKFKVLNRQSDITLADFWGIKKIEPDMYDDKGCSLAILHTDRAERFFMEVSHKIVYKSVIIEDALIFNKNMYMAVPEPIKREAFFRDYALSRLPLAKKLINVTRPGILTRLLTEMKRIIRLFLHFNR